MLGHRSHVLRQCLGLQGVLREVMRRCGGWGQMGCRRVVVGRDGRHVGCRGVLGMTRIWTHILWRVPQVPVLILDTCPTLTQPADPGKLLI